MQDQKAQSRFAYTWRAFSKRSNKSNCLIPFDLLVALGYVNGRSSGTCSSPRPHLPRKVATPFFSSILAGPKRRGRLGITSIRPEQAMENFLGLDRCMGGAVQDGRVAVCPGTKVRVYWW